MQVTLRGSSPATLAAGILLLSRARSFGQRISVEILGDPDDIGVVHGPALLHSVPLASCGVGRELGHGATVIVPGPRAEPLAISLSNGGVSDWFLIDRTNKGLHPATQAFVALRKDSRTRARWLGQQVVRGIELLGGIPDVAILDLLFGAPVAPLTRLSVALRAGRLATGNRGEPITRFLGEEAATPLERLVPETREAVEACLRTVEQLSLEDGGRYRPLADGMMELLSHLANLPPQSMISPLDPVLDSIAFGLARALTATAGRSEAQLGLLETYRFLGGRFTTSASYPVELPSDPPPPVEDRLGRLCWFCTHVDVSAKRAEKLWRDLVDPPQ